MIAVFALLSGKECPWAHCHDLEVDIADGLVKISVSDNGIGIDGRLLPQVFELFTQAERTPDRAQGGLGIGLALVKTIVALHKGSATAASAGPGLGSTFTIALPVAQGRAAPLPGHGTAGPAQGGRPCR